jgi:hypothetical protein
MWRKKSRCFVVFIRAAVAELRNGPVFFLSQIESEPNGDRTSESPWRFYKPANNNNNNNSRLSLFFSPFVDRCTGLPHPLQFIIHQPAYRQTLCICQNCKDRELSEE